MNICLLIDTKFFCYRALTTQYNLSYNEIRTGVHYGFFNSVKSIAKKLNTNNIIAMLDSEQSLRRELYPEYKRKKYNKPPNENMMLQLSTINTESNTLHQILDKLNIAWYKINKLEADDLFILYINKFQSKYDKIIIATSDEDIYQLLVQGKVEIYNPRTKKLYTEKDFRKEYGISPVIWSKIKAMGGCSSDNIPGLPRIGEKTAIKFFINSPGKESELGPDYQLYLKLTTLPIVHQEHRLLFKQTNLNINEFIKYCQYMGFRKFIDELQEFKNVFCI